MKPKVYENGESLWWLDDVILLDFEVYKGCDPFTLDTDEDLEKRVLANPDGHILAHQGARLVGYAEYILLNKKDTEYLWNASQDKIILKHIHALSPSANDIVALYISSLVVHPEFRDADAIKTLTQGLVKALAQYQHLYRFAIPISDDGVKAAKYLGLKQSSNTVYSLSPDNKGAV